MIIVDGLLSGVAYTPSPNCNERPPQSVVDVLVIHNISLPAGEFGTGCVPALFLNTLDCSLHPSFDSLRDLKVAAHLLIERDGAVTQFVNFNRRAWHAGVSSFQGRESCNDFSIGIELEGTDELEFTDSQYEALIAVTNAIRAYYAIPADHVVGHSDIAPGRKTDPGPAFDWHRYRSSMA